MSFRRARSASDCCAATLDGRGILRAAEAAHHEVIARRVVDAVRGAQASRWVVERASAQDMLALGRDRIRAGKSLSLVSPKLVERLEGVGTRRRYALRS